MTLSLDLANDYLIWDNRESIKYASTRRVGGSADEDVFGDCLGRALTYKEMQASNGAYTGQDRAWLIPQAKVTEGFAPKPGDVVTDSVGVAWTVLETNYNTFKTWHKLICRNLAIAYALRDIVTIERATVTPDATGAATRTWEALYTDLLCRVQPQEADVVEERGMGGQRVRYTVYVSRQLPRMDVRECRIKAVNVANLDAGTVLDIDGYSVSEQIAELPQIAAILHP